MIAQTYRQVFYISRRALTKRRTGVPLKDSEFSVLFNIAGLLWLDTGRKIDEILKVGGSIPVWVM